MCFYQYFLVLVHKPADKLLCEHKKTGRKWRYVVAIICKIKYCVLPLLLIGFSGIYLPLGDTLAAYQLVDWDFLAAIQLLKLSTGPVLPCSAPGHLVCVFSQLHDMYVSACLCTVVFYASTARSPNGSLHKHEALTDY